MDIWLVPSHRDIGPKPWDRYGVKLQSEDVTNGFEIWSYVGGNLNANDERFERTASYVRSRNEVSYNIAFTALSNLAVADGAYAVISCEWPHRVHNHPKYQLHLPKRIWLAVYHEDKRRFSLPESFMGQGKCYSFLECMEGDEWTQIFEGLLLRNAA